MRCQYILLLGVLTCGLSPTARGEMILFESGTLGQTGITWAQVSNQEVPGINITSQIFAGVRFELEDPVVTSQIGGHFIAREGVVGNLFGAIVRLSGSDDYPDSADLSTSDLVDTAIFTAPDISAEVFGDLSTTLQPGWYALVFGSGLFGTSGSGGALGNNPDIDSPQYLGLTPTLGWFELPDLSSEFVDNRFVLKGTIVPEPSALGVICLAILVVLMGRRRL